ncbi:MAG: hypothetical protein KAI76_03095 [Alphaproteobacteria bacterium]|nr:hypothetical protein [Alphaproteobacteria bacterium]
MRIFVPDMTEFFAWIDQSGYKYVVLRGFLDFVDQGYPARGSKGDVDLLVEDAACLPIRTRYGMYKKRKGVKCDVYNVSGGNDGGYLEHSYFPRELAKSILADRRLWKNKFYVPNAHAHLLSLIYHIAYQKAEISKIDISDLEKSVYSKYCRELEMLKEELSLDLPLTLMSFHRLLKQEGHNIPCKVLAAFLRHDFRNDCKSLFRAMICGEQTGEMNLFVIRTIAVKKMVQEHLLDKIRECYNVITIKKIPWHTRILTRSKMRGGKWRRGGYPCIAVVVFDPAPVLATEKDKKVHPFVLNTRQFVKPKWREWFTKTTGSKPSANPVHSTDNEAEAIGHLPLFFSPSEQEEIFQKLRILRG